MKITLFGATGALGSQCLQQALAAGHEVTVLLRNPDKLSPALRQQVHIVEGNALDANKVDEALAIDTKAVLFAIGVDKHSPENLCTDVTRHIFTSMRAKQLSRFIWCGGGSTLISEDRPGFGEKFVQLFSAVFLRRRHYDKALQYHYLDNNRDTPWFGVRPLQMKNGPHTGTYRLGFDRFSGLSTISFADCADAMLSMLESDEWLGKAPVVQY